jgi:hypothetical protein
LQYSDELLVCKFVELLYRLALYIGRTIGSQNIDEPGLIHFHVNPFGRQCDIAQKVTQFTRRLWQKTEFLFSEFL